MTNVYNKIIENLTFLHSRETLDVIDQTIDYVNLNKLSFLDGLLKLTEAQVEKKNINLINHAVKMAGFPRIKDLKDFDFDFQPSINKNEIMDYASLRFISKSENLIFYGNSGVGKTHLAISIGVIAAKSRISTYFIKCADLINSLHNAKLQNRLEDKLKKLASYKLLIIDELGYLPINKEDANLFFQLIDKRYEKFSTVLTTNINFSNWDEVFTDTMIANAILDRLLHHAHVITIKGKSFRLQHLQSENNRT